MNVGNIYNEHLGKLERGHLRTWTMVQIKLCVIMKTCGVDINMFYLFIFAIIIAGLKNFT